MTTTNTGLGQYMLGQQQAQGVQFPAQAPQPTQHERFLALCDELLKRGALAVQDGALSATFAPKAPPVLDMSAVYERLNTTPPAKTEEEAAEREAAELIP